MCLNRKSIMKLIFPAIHFFIAYKFMKSNLCFFTQSIWPYKTQLKIGFKNRFTLVKKTSSGFCKKISCKGAIVYINRFFIYKSWIINILPDTKFTNFFIDFGIFIFGQKP